MTPFESVRAGNEALSRTLLAMTAGAAPKAVQDGTPTHPADAVLHNTDAIVTHIEVNDKHGVGVFTRKLFGNSPHVLSIRSRDFYEGRQEFGDLHLRITHPDGPRDAVFARVLRALGGTTVRRVWCAPYFPDDALTAIALKEIFGAPLCTYVMDDQNLCSDGIPDAIMRELLAKSSLRLAISPELHAGYALKYGFPMWFMPPLVPTGLILPALNPPQRAVLEAREGVIVGNIWGQRWLELLRGTVRGSGITLRWYCNGDFRWLACPKETLAREGIVPHEGPALADAEMVEVLRRAAFVVVPSGTLDETDDRRFIAQLSFPSRIPYILATSQAPLIVLGHEATAAARFVREAGIGLVAPYGRAALQEAVERITRPEINLDMRRRALAMAGRFADIGAAEWIWQSLAKGEPIDRRFESMMPEHIPDLSHLIRPRVAAPR